jgi:hypothetical protein
MNSSALEMVIDGTRLFLCECVPEVSKGIKGPGDIFFVGNSTDEVRTKIRQVLSFCLGNYLVYLGSTMLTENSEIVAFSAESPPAIGRVSEIPVLPPSFLGNGNTMVADQRIVARMANAVYAHYDELRFNSFSWAYWHAMCAPVHMAAGHFGAATEALQKAYMKAHPAKFSTALITNKVKWKLLKDALLKAIAAAGLEPAVSTILTNKVTSVLNQTPPGVLSETMLAEIGITFGQAEAAAWKRRNQAAHGNEIDIDSVIPTIMETKLLKIILHRIVLKITGASERYYDDYTVGHAPERGFDIKKFAPRPAVKPVANEGFGNGRRKILCDVDDLEGFRRAGESRDSEAGAQRGSRVRHGCDAHISFGRDLDSKVGQGMGIEDHASAKFERAISTTLSVAPALRRVSGVTPANPGLGSRNHSHAARGSRMAATIAARPVTGRPSTNCSVGKACLRMPTRSPMTAPCFCQVCRVERATPKSRSNSVGPARGPAQSSTLAGVAYSAIRALPSSADSTFPRPAPWLTSAEDFARRVSSLGAASRSAAISTISFLNRSLRAIRRLRAAGDNSAAVALNSATSFPTSVRSPRLDFGLRWANMLIKSAAAGLAILAAD